MPILELGVVSLLLGMSPKEPGLGALRPGGWLGAHVGRGDIPAIRARTRAARLRHPGRGVDGHRIILDFVFETTLLRHLKHSLVRQPER